MLTWPGILWACLDILLSNLSSFQFPIRVSLEKEFSLFVHLHPNWLNLLLSVLWVHTSPKPLALTIARKGGSVSVTDIILPAERKQCSDVASFVAITRSWPKPCDSFRKEAQLYQVLGTQIEKYCVLFKFLCIFLDFRKSKLSNFSISFYNVYKLYNIHQLLKLYGIWIFIVYLFTSACFTQEVYYPYINISLIDLLHVWNKRLCISWTKTLVYRLQNMYFINLTNFDVQLFFRLSKENL